MLVLPLVVSLALSVAVPATSEAQGYLPTGSPVVLHDLSRLALLRHPGVKPLGFSSYDRTGGNNDGFKGTYSKLREEAGSSVLAEVSGPGILQRIWFTHSVMDHAGLLDRKGEHIRIYLDGHDQPALDVPLEDLLTGRLRRFPRPLVGEGSGGYVSYVPIAFQNGCKVVVDGLGVRFYQMNFLSLPAAVAVSSFRAEATQQEQADLDQAVRLWSHPGELAALGRNGADRADYAVDAIARTSLTFALPDGPRTIRSLEVQPTAETADAWRRARLRLIWDADDAETAGVDAPLGYAFGQAFGSAPYASLLVGQTASGWYLHAPMPYRRSARLRLDTEQPIRGTVRVLTTLKVDPGAGFFRAHYTEALPTQPHVDFPFLNLEGRGHYAGVFLATEGRAELPLWLEGDDRFTVDGQLAIHGTGTEDYFNGGWYAVEGRLSRPATYPSHGVPVYGKQGAFMRAALYRWHVADPVPFVHAIAAGIEHGEVNTSPADYRAAVFWYSDRPGSGRAVP